jgi:protein-S-isoprenylcysteine O-methyltransferase Ste14
MTADKDWRVDTVPVIFFGAIIIAKSYFLVGYLQQNQDLWSLVLNPERFATEGSGVAYYLTGQFSYLAYYLTSFAFDALVLYSFLVRTRAKERPAGFWENAFPLITVFVPVVGFALMFVPEVRDLLPRYPPSFLEAMADITPAFPFYMNLAGLLIGLLGASFSIWAIAHLRASFGLRAAVRSLVTTGPYSRIRHPLYFGEIIHVFGIALLAATPAALYLFVVAVALQVVRARIEEQKFLANVPEYAEFRSNTGFLWPKVFGRQASPRQ